MTSVTPTRFVSGKQYLEQPRCERHEPEVGIHFGFDIRALNLQYNTFTGRRGSPRVPAQSTLTPRVFLQ
jgi:hypothetical protein